MHRRNLFATGLLLALFGLLAACTSAPIVEVEKVVTATPETERAAFIYVRPQEVVSLDPARVTESQSGLIIRNTYSRLVDIAYDGSSVSPDLAESWAVSEDGLVYTFQLRSGVTFHDGTPLTTDDVVYSFDRMLSLGESDAAILLNVMDVGDTVALDETTVQITLNEPFPPFLQVIGIPRAAAILPQAWVEEQATEEDPWATEYLNDHVNGTGPYQFVEWVPNEFVRLTRFDDYYGGPAAIEEVISKISQDDTATRLSLEKGEVDVVQRLPDDMFRVLQSNPAVTVYNKPTASSIFWTFNTRIPPFDDVRVREAITLAIDYDGLMEGLVKEGGVRMNTPVYNTMPYYHADLPLIERDLERAKALLAEAGYADGLEIDLIYVEFGLLRQIAIVMQANLAEADIKVNVVEMPFGPFLEDADAGKIGFYSWVSEPNYPHPDAILDRFTTAAIDTGLGGNISFYENPAYDALIEQIDATTDPDELEPLYHRAQEMIMADMPWLLLYQENLYQATGAYVQGFDFGAYNYLNLHDVSIAR